MTNDSKLKIENHLSSFERCFEANKTKLDNKSIKIIYKYISKIRKELDK